MSLVELQVFQIFQSLCDLIRDLIHRFSCLSCLSCLSSGFHVFFGSYPKHYCIFYRMNLDFWHHHLILGVVFDASFPILLTSIPPLPSLQHLFYPYASFHVFIFHFFSHLLFPQFFHISCLTSPSPHLTQLISQRHYQLQKQPNLRYFRLQPFQQQLLHGCAEHGGHVQNLTREVRPMILWLGLDALWLQRRHSKGRLRVSGQQTSCGFQLWAWNLVRVFKRWKGFESILLQTWFIYKLIMPQNKENERKQGESPNQWFICLVFYFKQKYTHLCICSHPIILHYFWNLLEVLDVTQN